MFQHCCSHTVSFCLGLFICCTIIFSFLGLFITRVDLAYGVGWVSVSVTDAKGMMDSGASLVVVDVRNQSEYDSGHIQHCILLPLWQLGDRIDELDKGAKTLVYCSSGYRSNIACELLTNNSFTKVYNMVGGIAEWKTANYPVYVRYPSIQEAINDAPEGRSVLVSSGTYGGPVILNKTLILSGEDPENTIIEGNDMETTMTITRGGAVLEGFAFENSANAIRLTEVANNCSVLNCRILNSSTGIYVETEYNLLSENTVENCSHSAIKIMALCSCYSLKGNVISANSLSGNQYGLWLENSSESRIYHNNFLENTCEVFNQGSNATWDDGYPSGGNYWNANQADLFSGPNQNVTGSDGIADEPYVVDTNSTDRYPFIAVTKAYPAGIWDNSSFKILIESNFTVADFRFDPAEGSFFTFDTTSQNPADVGFCRIAIPIKLLWTEDIWTITLGNQSLYYSVSLNKNMTYLYFSYPSTTETLKIMGTGIISESLSMVFVLVGVSLSIIAVSKLRKPKNLSGHTQ
jgi:parallel beta-helix repeat protein